MADNNKSYRIRTKVGREADTFLNVRLEQDYDSLEILSLKISDKDAYKLHNSDYGVIVGRVLANGNFGVPNAKISVFIAADEQNSDMHMWNLYPYTSTSTKNEDGIRYNLLPDQSTKDCHVAVGTFPNKTYLLENESIIEVFDDYYLYTTRTNAAGDYLICGVPTGMQTLHMDLDLSDCGILSQRPRDFVYKGYTIEQFENPNQFKKDENLDGLSQIFSQNQPVYVKPFWGNEDNGDEIGITRADIEISFKFEPTCVFMGSAISDNASNGVGKKCVPTNQMGAMDELTAGEGTIEMIRKTPGGNVEEFSIKGNQLIDGNGVWCYQIPMNLDYMMTDEYGNMVPTDDPEKGIPTRTRVRFRASLTDMENGSRSYYRAKYLIPNNPGIDDGHVDYNFGTYTNEDSYRDLFWNGVYTVKSYIPRFQKSKRWKSERFSGIKACNYYGGNNPMPYNNMRIRLPFMFTVLCIFVKLFIKIVTLVNRFQSIILKIAVIGNKKLNERGIHCVYIGDGLCPDMEGWYFAPACAKYQTNPIRKAILFANTLAAAAGSDDANVSPGEYTDETSIDAQNISSDEKESVCLTTNIDFLLNCFEMNLAQEYRVIKFDFYNDWVNGVLYFPRWMRKVKRKKKYKFSPSKGIKSYFKDKVQGCMNSETSNVKKSRYYTQQCSLSYSGTPNTPWTRITSDASCNDAPNLLTTTSERKRNEGGSFKEVTEKAVSTIQYILHPSKCHKKPGMDQSSIFGDKSGLVTEGTTMLGQYVYYLKPCEWDDTNARTLLFATDIVLLGTLNDCDENGIPQAFKYLSNSSYIMPTNLALTTMDDDAYIYTNDNGTICLSNIKSAENLATRAEDLITPDDTDTDETQFFSVNAYKNWFNGDDVLSKRISDAEEVISQSQNGTENGASRVTPDYKSTHVAYSKTQYDKVDYGEYDDPIPVTEAAGIMWNYSGPGQDDVDLGKLETPDTFLGRVANLVGGGNRRNYLYYPGGHFLGLSCVNSDSNIKSCVNLKRICELGASMSQRREELRGYDENGKPQYRYYVPTGLISNVDIEGAAFRSMFATLNHNKLIATERNDSTGYKKYNFRYLRPDGFDGALASYVHQNNSPYNKAVNDENTPDAITDSRWYFEETFGNSWHLPDDYDPLETKYTERRTVEDTINDYYMFRFGLDTFNDKEQQKHYLKNDGNRHSMPQYENSFYFYFGLKDGATALDEFKKQFFSECERNTVMKAPSLVIQEEINTGLTCSATLLINNMLPGYLISLKDNTTGVICEKDELYDKDIVDLEDLCDEIDMIINHEYTVTVTDSLDRTLTKTFTFGASVIQLQASSVNFRFKVPETGTTNTDPKKGGYIKISEKITILGEEHSITDYELSTSEGVLPSGYTYTDTAGDTWVLYFVPTVGNYDIILEYGDMPISIYKTTVEDNTKINVYVACDYLSYKQDVIDSFDAHGNLIHTPQPTMGLSGISLSDWTGNTGPFSGDTWQNWLMRHTYYRQTQDDTEPFNNFIYTKDKNKIAVFGQPEKDGLTLSGKVLCDEVSRNVTIYKNDYDQYVGYSLDETYSFIPSLYWDINNHEETTAGTVYRNTFDTMAYSEDGRAAADASEVEITRYTYDTVNKKLTMEYNGTLEDGHGCIVVFENGAIVFPVVNGSDRELIAYCDDPYAGIIPDNVILSMSTVYPTLCVPSMYKPFYADVQVGLWNVERIFTTKDEAGETIVDKEKLPDSYKTEGIVYNGLTFYENRFDPGQPSPTNSRSVRSFLTYMVDEYSPAFWRALSAETKDENQPMRKLVFGTGSLDSGFCHEVLKSTGSRRQEQKGRITNVDYSIAESIPTTSIIESNVLTGRYENGFVGNIISDSCNISGVFLDDFKIRVADSSQGVNGLWSIYTTSEIPEGLKMYKAPTLGVYRPLFNASAAPMSIQEEEGGPVYCLGIYNENAEYDYKGSKTTVLSGAGDIFIFIKSKKDGTKTIQATTGEDSLYASGVTLQHAYLLEDTYKENLSAITQFIKDENLIVIRTPDNEDDFDYTTEVGGTGITGFIQVYEKPQEENSKNKLTVYKLYAFGDTDIMYPIAQEGGEDEDYYLQIQALIGDVWGTVKSSTGITTNTNRPAKKITVLISTNIDYKVTVLDSAGRPGRASWTEIYTESGNRASAATYSSTTLSFEIYVSAYSASAEADRGAIFRIEPNNPDISVPTLDIKLYQNTSP